MEKKDLKTIDDHEEDHLDHHHEEDHHEHHHDEHHHEGHHHHHEHNITSLSNAFIIGTVLNLLFVIAEGSAGFWSGSVGLLSDAGHNLSDTVSLLLAWVAFRLTRVPANKKYTYGYSKSTVLVSLINSVILLVAIGMILVESIRKFSNPQPVNEDAIIWVAAIGVVVNFATAMLFMKDRKEDLNVRGAFLHMAMDALVSVGVVVSGVVIKTTGWVVIDPIVGLVIAAIIFVSTWNLLKQSLRLSLDGVPEQIDVDKIEKTIAAIPYVENIHHIHVWALGTAENAMTVHVSVTEIKESENVKTEIRKALKQYKISHATIETEPEGYSCHECKCDH